MPGDPPQINITLKGAVVRIISGNKGSIRLDEETVPMPMPPQLWKGNEKKLDCLTYKECWERSKELAGKAHAQEAEIAWRGAVALMNGQPLPYAKRLTTDEEKFQLQQANWQIRKSRPTPSVKCTFAAITVSGGDPFVLLGCPIGVLLSRKDPLQTFFMCFAPIVVLYYPSVILTFNVFKEGVDESSFISGSSDDVGAVRRHVHRGHFCHPSAHTQLNRRYLEVAS